MNKQLRKETLPFRRKFIQEYLEKENPSKTETSIIKSWVEHYGKETY